MKVLGVVGPSDAEETTLVERLAERLAERGRVGTVASIDEASETATGRYRDAGAAVAYGLTDDEWVGSGGSRSLGTVLDRLAAECDYALVQGFPDARIPQVVLGDAEPVGDVLVAAPDAAAVDVDALLDDLAATEPRESLASLVAQVKRSPGAERSGAIATFTGRVRGKDGEDDDHTVRLEFEKYEGVADERLAVIESELTAREGVYEVLLHHRTGVIEDGENIVFVVVLAGHREEAFRTVEDGINRLKDEVPIFKKEITIGDEFWVHERE